MTAARPPSGSRRPSVLIANRGEIAIRVARTCRMLGFPSVAVYSDPDRDALHARSCDRAISIGGTDSRSSYLDIAKIIAAAKASGATMIHPGYGFLSERPHFADACAKAGLVFVGPSAESMRTMGDKIRARETVMKLGVPQVPGSPGAVSNSAEARRVAREIGYPVLLKAAAGGGGKGMRRVDQEKEIENSFEGASREAMAAFGDGSLYVEKYVLEPHHVEIQVFGDGKGGAIHLGERECSIQRRHQKVWEETPAPILERHPSTREKMFQDAIRVASAVKYAGAGTFEFIVDGEGHHYFLEMNTRLQVEHPVTEWVTGVDLVAWQLLLACGEWELPSAPPARTGAAVEVRVYAEDPENFLPAPGPLGRIRLPSGSFVRFDSAIENAGEISMLYDPMIAKISTWAPTRAEAIHRLERALSETEVTRPCDSRGLAVGSLRSNLRFLRKLAAHPDTLKGDTPTDFIARRPELTRAEPTELLDPGLALAVAVASCVDGSPTHRGGASTLWRDRARAEGMRTPS